LGDNEGSKSSRIFFKFFFPSNYKIESESDLQIRLGISTPVIPSKFSEKKIPSLKISQKFPENLKN